MPTIRIRHAGFLRSVEQTIYDYNLFQEGDSVLVGVSGGPDSVALLYALIALSARFSFRIGVAHLNHSLRKKDSDNDAAFVAGLAEKLNLPFYLKKEDVHAYRKKHKLSIEEAARQVRYAFYLKLAKKNRYDKIALGHHLDDNVELILMNLIRGSAKTGMTGIPPAREGMIVRPLITVSKKEIHDFIDTNKIDYVTDKTNRDMRYFRNRVRHQLLPLLKKSYNPEIVDAVNRLGIVLSSEEEWIDELIDGMVTNSALSVEKNKIIFSVALLGSLHVAAKRRIIRKGIEKIKGDLRRIAFSHIQSAVRLIEKGPITGSLDLPDRIRIERDHDVVSIVKEKQLLRSIKTRRGNQHEHSFTYTVLEPGFQPKRLFIEETGRYLLFSKIGFPGDVDDIYRAGNKVAFFDMDTLYFPLIVRNWREGDFFSPLGMTGTQKVSRFFINNKVPGSDRVNGSVLVSRGKIIWLIGYRIDESVKVRPETRNILKVELLLA